jgi:hypothetical protein
MTFSTSTIEEISQAYQTFVEAHLEAGTQIVDSVLDQNLSYYTPYNYEDTIENDMTAATEEVSESDSGDEEVHVDSVAMSKQQKAAQRYLPIS